MRLQAATGGKALFEGQDILAMSEKEFARYQRKIQIIFQNPYASLNPRFTVGQILMEPMQVHRIGANDIERKQLFYDSKTIFQEIVQEKGLQPVEYVLTEEKGPDHDKQFTVEVRVNGEVFGCGTGHTKKAAEQAAAYQAIQEKKI